MTIDDLVRKLLIISEYGVYEYKGKIFNNEECDHIKADELLLEFINNSDVTDAFNAIKKWYS